MERLAAHLTVGDDTRERLLVAAGSVFADRGFGSATVREICQLAGANLAAVNYHFGGKEGLYEAVFSRAASEARARFGMDAVFDSTGSGADRLEAFVRIMLAKVLGDDATNTHGRLMLREMVEPTPVLGKVVENEIRPFMGHLQGIVRELLGPEAGEDVVRRGCNSVVGQCLFYKHCRPVLEVLYPGVVENAEELSEHIVTVCLGGLNALAGKVARPQDAGVTVG